MTWPKRHTRRIHIGDVEYLWHLSGNNIDTPAHVTVGTESGAYFLFVDPYAHDFEITPSNVKAATEWALAKGWSPDNGPTKRMAYYEHEECFVWVKE